MLAAYNVARRQMRKDEDAERVVIRFALDMATAFLQQDSMPLQNSNDDKLQKGGISVASST